MADASWQLYLVKMSLLLKAICQTIWVSIHYEKRTSGFLSLVCLGFNTIRDCFGIVVTYQKFNENVDYTMFTNHYESPPTCKI